MKRLFLIVTCFSIAYGQQNAEFRYVEDCYSAGDTLTLEAKYNGSGTPTAVQWSYSEETSSNLVIATATCTVFASVPTGFPQVSRLNYTCESVHSLPSNTYRLTVTGLQSSELNNSWGATFTPPVGTSPAAVQVALPLCDTTTPAGCACDCCCQPRFYFGIIFGVIVLICLIVGSICVYKEYLVGENFEDFSIWVWILCPFAVGLGILIVWLIWEKGGLKKCCKDKNNGCKAGFVVLGFCLVAAYLGIQIGSIAYVCLKDQSGNCCKDEDKNTCCTDKDLCGDIGIWIWIVWTCIIGVLTMIVGLIVEIVVFKAYCNDNAGNGDAPPRGENPHPETWSGNQHGAQQHYQGRPHREQPPIPDGATGTTLNGREDSDSAVSRRQVELEETGHSLERRPMPAIPPGQGIQVKNNKIHDSKGRGLSANFDDAHILVGIDTPAQKKGLEKIKEVKF